MHDQSSSPDGGVPLSRRRLLGVAVAAVVLGACGDGGSDSGGGTTSSTEGDGERSSGPKSTSSSPASSEPGSAGGSPAPLTVADFADLGTCVLLPAQMAGPFPLDEQFDRRDITEGYPGQPMRLGFRVVDRDCEPVPGAKVEVWHCDAGGDYSAFIDQGGGKDEGEGTTFLRGTQAVDDDGIVEFLTIVPGWYTGRAVHVHLRVHLEDEIVLTSQVYFDPDHLAEVYRDAPYAEFGPPDTSNEADTIAGTPETDGTLLHTTSAETSAGPGTLALVNLGIDTGQG